MSRSKLYPEEIAAVVETSFLDPDRPSFAQLATVSEGKPQVRTVHFRLFPELQVLAFTANVNSPKWKEAHAVGRVALCLYDQSREIQLRAQALTTLIDAKDPAPQNQELRSRMWKMLREEIRKAYWLAELERPMDANITGEVDLDEPPNGVGTIKLQPEVWDVFWNVPDRFREGHRSVFRREGQAWRALETSLIDSRVIA